MISKDTWLDVVRVMVLGRLAAHKAASEFWGNLGCPSIDWRMVAVAAEGIVGCPCCATSIRNPNRVRADQRWSSARAIVSTSRAAGLAGWRINSGT